VPSHLRLRVLTDLLSRTTVACWNLQKLRIAITDHHERGECSRHSRQHAYEHQQKFLQSIRLFHHRLRSFKRLCQDNMTIIWNTCGLIRDISMDEALPRINGWSSVVPGVRAIGFSQDHCYPRIGTLPPSPRSKENPEITRQDLNWLGLYWSSNEERRQEAEAHTKRLLLIYLSNRIRYPSDEDHCARHRSRVGCGWKDWWELAGLCTCPHYCKHMSDCGLFIDDDLDRHLSGDGIQIERGHRRRSMLRCRRKIIK